MSWRKYFTPVEQNTSGGYSPFSVANRGNTGTGPANSNYSSFLPDVYVGTPNRVERYGQYNVMDLDSEVNAALDILAEFCTQTNKQNNTPFFIRFQGEATNSEVTITQKYLQQWCKLQEFETRMFRIMRNCFKYGDEIFIRDPETKKMYHVDPANVTRIIVNESEGKLPEQYVIKNFNINFREMVATTPYQTNGNVTGGGSGYLTGGVRGMVGQPNQSMAGSRFMTENNEIAVDAKHVVHLSMSEGLDNNYPFGNSLLETVFKVYKQKELLEDAIIIYRVQRAPERRVFYIDTGNMPSHLAMQFVERVKTQIHQRRIPSKTGGGQNVIDSSYNPISIQEDFYFPQTSEGRGSKVETLPAGCLSMDTQVSLLDGRELSINEIKNEMDSGKKLWTYSVNPETGEIAPGLISWAGVTQKSAKVMRLTLDNGNQITCTPDHKFPVYGKGFVRADKLVKNQSMMPLYRKNENISEYKKLDYEQFFDNYEKKWKYTHRVVADILRDKEVKYYIYDESISDGKYDVRHHIDFNRYNNSPENLTFMSWYDHSKLHSDKSFSEDSQRKGSEAARKKILDLKENNTQEYEKMCDKISKKSKKVWATVTDEEKSKWSKNISNGIKKYFENMDSESKEKRAEISRKNWKKGSKVLNEKLKNDPDFNAWFRNQQSIGFTAEKRKEAKERLSKYNNEIKWGKDRKKSLDNHRKKQKIEYSYDMLTFIINSVKGKTTNQVSLSDVTSMMNKNDNMIKELLKLNKNKSVPNWKPENGFTKSMVKKIPTEFGYDSWMDFRKNNKFQNHVIVDIEWLEEPMEVGTLTIDQDEIYHNYHTFALTAGIFTKNSNLGEIDDLRFFTNKLVRGLRIPSSYLPTGADDGNTQYNDGRVGTAYIQELRFNTYCERLQNMVIGCLDTEFKYYLLSKGVNIDTSMFTLKFQPPQNFASYRQSEIDNARVPTYTQMSAIPYISNRFALKRFLGMTDEEIAENERLWREENDDSYGQEQTNSAGEMRGAGITGAGIESDMAGLEDTGMGDIAPEEGGEAAGPETSTQAGIGPVGSETAGTTPQG